MAQGRSFCPAKVLRSGAATGERHGGAGGEGTDTLMWKWGWELLETWMC